MVDSIDVYFHILVEHCYYLYDLLVKSIVSVLPLPVSWFSSRARVPSHAASSLSSLDAVCLGRQPDVGSLSRSLSTVPLAPPFTHPPPPPRRRHAVRCSLRRPRVVQAHRRRHLHTNGSEAQRRSEARRQREIMTQPPAGRRPPTNTRRTTERTPGVSCVS